MKNVLHHSISAQVCF